MKRLTPIEVRRAQMLKAARTAIRLKHSLAADAEIAEQLPEIEERIDRALATGEVLELTPGAIVDAA